LNGHRSYFDQQADLSQRYLIPRLQPYTARTRRNGNGFAVSKNARSMQTSIVTETIISPTRAVDVSMLSGYAQIRLSGRLVKSHVVRPDQTIAVVANVGAPSQVYARACENVSRLFSRALNNSQFQSRLCNIGLQVRLRRTGKAVELKIEFRGRPMWL